ncbi:family 78 glycoside hydrolase catalytic domain [Domibacillus sp. PGB-M46]|uniref:family 78 glycoside hydrolase catalytic domain n=1 Tax=Domibacillus sp. PGB-M46 TaxID=2910255 RepID=UPI0035C90A09
MLKVKTLTCEYRDFLLGTDILCPRFSWKLASDKNHTVQEGYQIQVSLFADDFESPLWDTGKQKSSESIHLTYDGPSVASKTRYYYRVRVWDNYGRESDWSSVQWWETSLLSSEDWQAKWITPHPDFFDRDSKPISLFRKPFSIAKAVKSARIHATAAGIYDLYLNDQKIGDALFAPGWTSYKHHHQYQTYDVTDLLSPGTQAIGAAVADGWYKGELTWLSKRNIYGQDRALLLQMHILYEDGTKDTIVSDESWKTSIGPIVLSEFYAGESYDARLECNGWSTGNFQDTNWKSAKKCALSFNQLVAQENWPTKVTEVLSPISVLETPKGETVLDMGQNMVGRVRMNIDIPDGQKVVLYHAEVLDSEGNFYTGNLRKAQQKVEYISNGKGPVSFAPHFSFQGFRYVKVEGLTNTSHEELLKTFQGEVIHTDMPQTGYFECSSPLVNQLYSNILWGQRGNFLDVPTDCPQRDERLGWTGDAQIFARTAAYNYQVAPFFTKWLRDLKSDQTSNGTVPFVIPDALEEYISTMWGDNNYTSSAWGDAATICPWTIYRTFGDVRLLEEQYESMKAWVDYIRAQGANEFLWNTGFHFGDWLALDAEEDSYFGATPEHLVATAYYAYSTRILKDTAQVLSKIEDASKYERLLKGIIQEFQRTYVTTDGKMKAHTQTAHILPLVFDLVEGENRQQVAADLNQLIIDNGYHLDTGFVGTPYLCIALSENGYHETALRLLLQESYPSWLFSVLQGATTIWEHWDGIKEDGSFWSDDMNSYNHYAYGAIGEWLYRYVAGIDLEEAAYRVIKIHPHISQYGLSSAKASLDSPYGTILCSWEQSDQSTDIHVKIPANTTAKIILNNMNADKLVINNLAPSEVENILVKEGPDGLVCEVGSGSYSIQHKKEGILLRG